MQWLHPQEGHERIRYRFFWFPDTVGAYTYWLTLRRVQQRYHVCCECWGWETVKVLS